MKSTRMSTLRLWIKTLLQKVRLKAGSQVTNLIKLTTSLSTWTQLLSFCFTAVKKWMNLLQKIYLVNCWGCW